MPAKQLTHFLCLPLVNQHSKAQLQASLQHFSTIATAQHDIPPKAIRPVGTIHLTLGVMNLPTQERIDSASAYLKSLDIAMLLKNAVPATLPPPSISQVPDVKQAAAADTSVPTAVHGSDKSEHAIGSLELGKQSEPLIVSLTGLQSMRNSSKTSMLYTSPNDPTFRLQSFCEALGEQFTAAEFLVPEKRSLLLHATIVNTLYAKGGRNRHAKFNRNIDATSLLKEFEDYEWAKDIHIEKVCICQMGAKKEVVDEVVVNEEYLEIASIALP